MRCCKVPKTQKLHHSDRKLSKIKKDWVEEKEISFRIVTCSVNINGVIRKYLRQHEFAAVLLLDVVVQNFFSMDTVTKQLLTGNPEDFCLHGTKNRIFGFVVTIVCL